MVETLIEGGLKLGATAFTASCISNVISTVIDKVTGRSTNDHIENLTEEIKLMKEEFISKFNITHEVQKGLLNNFNQLSQTVEMHQNRINFLMGMVPRVTWMASFIQTEIATVAADLETIIHEYGRGKVAVKEIGHMLKLPHLMYHEYLDSEFVLLEPKTQDMTTLRLVFKLQETSYDTFVYRVNPFQYWEDLTGTPKLMKYVGSEYLIHNMSNNCLQAIEKPTRRLVDQSCDVANFLDPKLQLWESRRETRDIYSQNDTIQIKKTIMFNYIYGFPFNITLRSGTFRMPPHVFRLSTDIGYKIDGLLPYHPKIVAMNISDAAKWEPIDSIHPGHFPMGSEMNDEGKWFEKIQEMQILNEKLLQQYNNGYVIVKHSPVYWILICILSLMALAMGAWSLKRYIKLHVRRNGAVIEYIARPNISPASSGGKTSEHPITIHMNNIPAQTAEPAAYIL